MANARKWKTTTVQRIQACIDSGMSIRQAAYMLEVSEHMLRHTCSVLGIKPHGWAGPKPNAITQTRRPASSVFQIGAN